MFVKKPSHKFSIGAKIRDNNNRVELPIWMGSMTKIKNTNIKEFDK